MFGSSKNRRTSSVGSLRKQSTLCQPRSPSCADSSRAKVSVPPMRCGATPNIETSVGIVRKSYRVTFSTQRCELLGDSKGSSQPRGYSFAQLSNPKAGVVGEAESVVQNGRLILAHKGGHKVALVSKAQDATIFI